MHGDTTYVFGVPVPSVDPIFLAVVRFHILVGDLPHKLLTLHCRKGAWRPKDNYIGGATPRPTFTRAACSVPSGCLTAAAMKMLAPGFSSLFSPGT